MGGNSWGEWFRVSSFGESHGAAVGVVVEGCPAGLELGEEDIQSWLDRRRPGRSRWVSPRQEPDRVLILSGVYEGRTTGAPLALLVHNRDAEPAAYKAHGSLLRPGHAGFTYWKKWGHFDPRGGGRSSARETLARVCAGAVAAKLLTRWKIRLCAFVAQLGPIKLTQEFDPICLADLESSPVRCPDRYVGLAMQRYLEMVQEKGDSVGAVIEGRIEGLPAGLGAPVFDRFQARLACAMMSLPAARGFSLGEGFGCAAQQGSGFNDSFGKVEGRVQPLSNHSAGVMGGLTTGQRVRFQLAFKPTSSIRLAQRTCNTQAEEGVFEWPQGFRHDPCVAIRACPIVEAMSALVCIDFLLMRSADRLEFLDPLLERGSSDSSH